MNESKTNEPKKINEFNKAQDAFEQFIISHDPGWITDFEKIVRSMFREECAKRSDHD